MAMCERCIQVDYAQTVRRWCVGGCGCFAQGFRNPGLCADSQTQESVAESFAKALRKLMGVDLQESSHQPLGELPSEFDAAFSRWGLGGLRHGARLGLNVEAHV